MKKLLLLLTLFSFFNGQLNAQISDKSRPKIGLVLAGGGAKGLAEVGAIKVLEEAGIRPDYITGTSIGSIVGGLYAAGYSVDELYALAQEIDWNYYFNDDIERYNFPVTERGDADKYLLNFPLEDGKILLPKGVVIGKKISLLLSRLTMQVHGCTDFDNLDIPFRAVATDFSTGEAVVISEGCLPDAMRASMSIPSVFEPVALDGKLLIDGASARNMPVQDVLDMGADIVIAVDIGGPLLKDKELDTALDVMVQAGSYIITQENEKQRELADFIIEPDIQDIGPLDFDRADTLLARGERAARAVLPDILAKIEPRNLPERISAAPLEKVKINGLEIQHTDKRQYKVVRNILQLKVGETYSVKHLERRMQILLGSQFVRNVRYRLVPQDDGYILTVQSDYQSGNFLRAGINYDSNLKAGLLLNATLRNALIRGSKLSIDGRVSENPALLASYTLYTAAVNPSIGINFGGKIHFYPGEFYENGELVDAFDLHHYEGRADVFSDINNRWLAQIGIGIEQYSQARALFDPDAESLRLNQANLYFNLIRDTYDRLHFPRAGSLSSIDAKFSFGGRLRNISNDTLLVNSNLNGLVRTNFNRIFPVSKKFVAEWGVDGGISAYADNNFLNLFYLGRSIPYENNFVEFAGLDYMELPVTAFVFSALKFRFEPKPDIFTSAVVNYGYYNVRNFLTVNEDGGITQITDGSDRIFGAGLEAGMLTIAGPIKIQGQYNFFTRRLNWALHMGYVF